MGYTVIMRRIRLILIILLLIGSTVAVPPKNTLNQSQENAVLQGLDIARTEGAAEAAGGLAKIYYTAGTIDYSSYFEIISAANIAIRKYNALLEKNFNESIVMSMKRTEFTL